MHAEQSLRGGDLDEALTELQQQVRQHPAQAELRVFLFQLLSVTGQWERALNQLKVVGEMDAATLPMVQVYRAALQCEPLRAEVFAGKRSPLVFGTPEQWLALMIRALSLTAAGEHSEAAQLRGRALEDAPASSGRVDEHPFAWLMDGDPRLGPVLEAIVNGRYYWIPLRNIRSIRIEKPADLRDLVWLPASFTWSNGGEAVGLIPTRYPGSERSPDAQIRLGRKTEWPEQPGGTCVGLGQRIFYADDGEYPVMDVRAIDFAPVDEPPAAAGDAIG